MITDEDMRVMTAILDGIVEHYGLHRVALSLMQIIDKRAENIADNWKDVTLAKHWAACAPAAVALEAVTQIEFGG